MKRSLLCASLIGVLLGGCQILAGVRTDGELSAGNASGSGGATSTGGSGGAGGSGGGCGTGGMPSPGDVLWAKQLTGLSLGGIAFNPVSGELYAAGSFTGQAMIESTVLTSAGGSDAFLAKWGPTCELLWARSFGDNQTQTFNALTVDATGRVYAAFRNTGALGIDQLASTTSRSGLIQFDAMGAGQWLTPTGGSFDFLSFAGFRHLAVATDGALLATGPFQGPMLIGSTSYTASSTDGIVAKFDAADGAPMWSFQYGTSASDGWGGIAPAPGGGLYLTGSGDGPLNFPGGQIDAGGDGFVARFGASGSLLWGQAFGSLSSFEEGRAVASDAAGNVFIGGFFNGSFAFTGGGQTLTSNGDFDLFLAKLDQAGSHQFSAAFGDVGPAGYSGPAAISTGPDGGLVVAGELTGTLTFGNDVLVGDGNTDGYVAKIDGVTGTPIWALKIGGASYQSVQLLSVGGDNRIAIGGRFEGAILLGEDSFVSAAGYTDPFIAVLAP